MNASKDEGEEAVDGFEPLPDEQEQPAEALPQRPSKPSYAFVAVLTTLVLAYTNQSLTGGTFAPTCNSFHKSPVERVTCENW